MSKRVQEPDEEQLAPSEVPPPAGMALIPVAELVHLKADSSWAKMMRTELKKWQRLPDALRRIADMIDRLLKG